MKDNEIKIKNKKKKPIQSRTKQTEREEAKKRDKKYIQM